MGEVSGSCTHSLRILGAGPLWRSGSSNHLPEETSSCAGAVFNPEVKEGQKREPLQAYEQAGCCPAISWSPLRCCLFIPRSGEGLSWATACCLVPGIPGKEGSQALHGLSPSLTCCFFCPRE